MPRYAAKVDATHRQIAAAIRAAGGMVVPLEGVGRGVPDIAVMHRGETHWIEIKSSASEARRKGKTADAQQAFRDDAAHRGVAVHVVWTVEQALQIMGVTDA